jgi:hypothetical protein
MSITSSINGAKLVKAMFIENMTISRTSLFYAVRKQKEKGGS